MRTPYVQFCVWVYIPTTTTLAGECFNSLIFHGNIKSLIKSVAISSCHLLLLASRVDKRTHIHTLCGQDQILEIRHTMACRWRAAGIKVNKITLGLQISQPNTNSESYLMHMS